MFIIAVAEMGDKTQLVALSFATRYKPVKVLTGVFLATLAVHLLSVAIGEQATNFVPIFYLKIAVGISFIAFGIWTLKGDSYEEEEKGTRFGPILTVGIAFFIAELGDKTQLATISLAAKYRSFLEVWLGSTIGMVIADALAIGVGILAGKTLPQRTIKFVSAGVFILFGILTIFEALIR